MQYVKIYVQIVALNKQRNNCYTNLIAYLQSVL